jgi:hypothetical protein
MATPSITDAWQTYFEISVAYAPYHTMPAFRKGAEDYMDSKNECPFTGLDARVWDRGNECASRFSPGRPMTVAERLAAIPG